MGLHGGLCVKVYLGEGSSLSAMVLITCEWYSQGGEVNRFKTEKLKRLKKVSWGECMFLFNATDLKSVWILFVILTEKIRLSLSFLWVQEVIKLEEIYSIYLEFIGI